MIDYNIFLCSYMLDGWSSSLSFTDSGSHTLAHTRLSSDVMVDSQFRWQPYTDEIHSKLYEHCREGSNIWWYKGPLISFFFYCGAP